MSTSSEAAQFSASAPSNSSSATCVYCGDKGAERGLCPDCRGELRARELGRTNSLTQILFAAGRGVRGHHGDCAGSPAWEWKPARSVS